MLDAHARTHVLEFIICIVHMFVDHRGCFFVHVVHVLLLSFPTCRYTAGTQYFGNAIEAPPKRKQHPPGHPSAAAARSFGIPQHCIEKLGVPIPHGHGKLYRGPPTNSLMCVGWLAGS